MLTRYWRSQQNGAVKCLLCPRFCVINNNESGHCFVRKNIDGNLVLISNEKVAAYAIDPIEKKPLYHFYPGTPILSIGSPGCNLACSFCQNWSLTKDIERLNHQSSATPQSLVSDATGENIPLIAFTYNDPVIYLEFAAEVADVAHQNNIKTVAVTAGYINKKPMREFFSFIDAANIDLKSISENFYKDYCDGSLAPVLDTLVYVKHETATWLEITNLIIPGLNDSIEEINQLSNWVYKNLGENTPLHFSGFHPDYNVTEINPTTQKTLIEARNIAIDNGLKFVYTGNTDLPEGESTWCPGCNSLVISRNRWKTENHLDHNKCPQCGTVIPGVF